MADNLQPGDIVYQNSPRSTSAQAVGSDNQLHGVQLVASPGGDIIYQEDESSNIAMALGDDGNYHRVMLVYSLGGEGGGTSLDKIIIKSKTIPAASETEYGRMRIYAGEDDGTYTHGYIYECKGTESYELNPFGFLPQKMGFNYTNADPNYGFTSDAEAMIGFITTVLHLQNPTDVKTITLVVDESTLDPNNPSDYGMWEITCKDEDGNVILSDYRIYGADLETFGFVFINPSYDYHSDEPLESDPLNWIMHVSNLYWDRIDVQPTSGGGVTTRTITLSSSGWTNNTQTVSCPGVTASNTVVVGPTPASGTDYGAAGIICTAQAANSLTFTCDTTPSANIDVNVIIM